MAKTLSERRRKYIEARGDGKGITEAARLAGFSESFSVHGAYKLERDSLVCTSIERRRSMVQRSLEIFGCDLPLFAKGMKRSVGEGNPAALKLYLQLYEVMPEQDVQVLVMEIVRRCAGRFMPYVPEERKSDFNRAVAELAGMRGSN